MEGSNLPPTEDDSETEEQSSFLSSSLWNWESNENADPVEGDQQIDIGDEYHSEIADEILKSTDSTLQRQNHRLLLQGFISALVVVLSGLIVMLSKIGSYIGFIIFHRPSLITLYQSVASNLHFTFLVMRICAEVLIVVAILAVFAHRIVGFALGLYLRSVLDPKRIGQFAFHFDWISLRCGLDQNMLVISGLEWRNPPSFTNTPYFLRISEINFVIDSASVYHAIMSDSAIKISQIKLDKATIYLEKLSQRSINRANLLQKQAPSDMNTHSESTKSESEISCTDSSSEQGLHRDIDLAADAAHEHPATTAAATAGTAISTPTINAQMVPPSPTPVSNLHSVSNPVSTPKPVKQLPVGMLNLWACLGATDVSQEASFLSSVTRKVSKAMSGTTNMVQLLGSAVAKLDLAGALFKGAQNVGSSIGSTIGKNFMRTFGSRKASSADTNPAPALASSNSGNRDRTHTLSSARTESDDDNLNISTHSAGQGDSGTLTMAETIALLQAEYPDLVLPPLPEDAVDEEGVISEPMSPAPAAAPDAAKKKSKKDAWKGFGVPFRLEIDQLYLIDLRLNAQDFLNAKHTKGSKASAIKLQSLTMFRNELTLPPKKKLDKHRRGIYLDDVVWRLVNKLLAELLRHNSIAMMVLLSSAAANNATSAVSTSATSARRAMSGLGNVFAGRSTNNNNTSTNTSTRSPTRPRSDTSSSGHLNSETSAAGIHATGGNPAATSTTSTTSTTAATASDTTASATSTATAAATQAQAAAHAAAQSALKHLNSTGNDAMNAFSSMMKRSTASTK